MPVSMSEQRHSIDVSGVQVESLALILSKPLLRRTGLSLLATFTAWGTTALDSESDSLSSTSIKSP